MNPTLWGELIGAVATLAIAVAGYLTARTANGKANTAVTALTSHVLMHRIPNGKGLTMADDQAPELLDPIGANGSSLMGMSPPAMQDPAPEASEPEAPSEDTTESAPVPPPPVETAEPAPVTEETYTKDDLRRLLGL